MERYTPPLQPSPSTLSWKIRAHGAILWRQQAVELCFYVYLVRYMSRRRTAVGDTVIAAANKAPTQPPPGQSPWLAAAITVEATPRSLTAAVRHRDMYHSFFGFALPLSCSKGNLDRVLGVVPQPRSYQKFWLGQDPNLWLLCGLERIFRLHRRTYVRLWSAAMIRVRRPTSGPISERLLVLPISRYRSLPRSTWLKD